MKAHFEVYILNYNGAHYLRPCLEHLRQVVLSDGNTSYTMSVNVVDNGSTDPSEQVVRSDYPEVNYIPLGFNHGFSKGNNLGVQHRVHELAQQGKKADFHVLLNSDTEVRPNWLLGAAEAFADPRVGIVGSKAVFRDRFAIVTMQSEQPFSPADFGVADPRQLGVFLHTGYAGTNIRTEPGRMKLPDAYPRLGHGSWLKPTARVYLPVIDERREAAYSFYVENHHPGEETVKVALRGDFSREVSVTRHHPARFTLNLSPREYKEIVQNAGSFITPEWSAGDRGFLEPDYGQHDTACEVEAICGVSMFVRAELWEKLSGFDEHFFAYYEDADLSLRARRMGFRCVYAPNSELLHVHAGSGVEFSDYFNRNVTWSHLLFASKVMNREQWRAKKRECRRLAMHEFETFKRDNALADKPHLAAYCRYLKQLPNYTKNRISRRFWEPEQLLFARPLQASQKAEGQAVNDTAAGTSPVNSEAAKRAVGAA